MAQGVLDAAKQEENAKMAIEAAELGRQVAAQVDAEVSNTQSAAQQMIADEKQIAIKNKKNEEADAKIRAQVAQEKAEAAKSILRQEEQDAREGDEGSRHGPRGAVARATKAARGQARAPAAEADG